MVQKHVTNDGSGPLSQDFKTRRYESCSPPFAGMQTERSNINRTSVMLHSAFFFFEHFLISISFPLPLFCFNLLLFLHCPMSLLSSLPPCPPFVSPLFLSPPIYSNTSFCLFIAFVLTVSSFFPFIPSNLSIPFCLPLLISFPLSSSN